MNIYTKKIIGLLMLLLACRSFGQQDPQFTQYMYNTLSVNSAYAGSRGHLSVTGIHRTQWVGIDGAPQTQTLTVDTPLGKNVGLGLAVINDEIGPSDEIYFDANFSYTIRASNTHKLSFGVKGGGRLLNIDWTKGQVQNPDVVFQQNINNRFLPTVGAGLYLHGESSYLGVSVPNFFTDQHYDDIQGSVASERLHFFLIGGLIFDLSKNTKFKPAFLLKHVVGAPLIVDISANFMLYDRFRIGASYRWDDSFSGLAGFQITPGLLIGYAYDYTTTRLQNFTTGSHEIMLRFELKSEEKRLKSPRFF
ncbi:type IX secretion system membrane protein PorP/SprF [Aquimarina sp. U1-2]|uniref:PorP/SprF family type IX secretion system membrane protein n=1 Tax=Aquimarina sp. U1-2 TaxID=2823141 RepID=UPI001AEC8065|nr:type IX secretion system membrane protein PorP/SprF [Aquimarina sp. U1-2]MBP2833996.1 type IX secretion system membrane protein PorP/SprF [Aquimarina sp. U1-2]